MHTCISSTLHPSCCLARSCRIYNLSSKHCTHTVSKIVPRHASSSAPEGLAVRIFHDDTLRSFFRRLAFSPDGQLLITPAGLMETSKGQTNATFVFARGAFKEWGWLFFALGSFEALQLAYSKSHLACVCIQVNSTRDTALDVFCQVRVTIGDLGLFMTSFERMINFWVCFFRTSALGHVLFQMLH